MPRNPFRKQTPYERALREVKKSTAEARSKAKKSAAAAELATGRAPEPARKPLLAASAVGVAGVVVATILGLRKVFSGTPTGADAPGVPSPDVSPTAPSGPTDDRLNDPALKAKVESELFADKDVPKERISIGAADGVVTLRGTLDSVDQTTRVTAQAEQIDGVRRVENLLTFPRS